MLPTLKAEALMSRNCAHWRCAISSNNPLQNFLSYACLLLGYPPHGGNGIKSREFWISSCLQFPWLHCGKRPSLPGMMGSRTCTFPTRSAEVWVLLMSEIKLGALWSNMRGRQTNTIQEHLGEVSYKIHMNSWPRLLALLSLKINVVLSVTLRVILCATIFYSFLMTRINSNIKHSSWTMTYVNPSRYVANKVPKIMWLVPFTGII